MSDDEPISAVFTSSRYRHPPPGQRTPTLSNDQRRSHGTGVRDTRERFLLERIAIGFVVPPEELAPAHSARRPAAARRHTESGGRAAAAFIASFLLTDDGAGHTYVPSSPTPSTPALLTSLSSASSSSATAELRTPEYFDRRAFPFPEDKDGADVVSAPAPTLASAFEPFPLPPVPELRPPPRLRQASADPPSSDSGTATPRASPSTPSARVRPKSYTPPRPPTQRSLSELISDTGASRASSSSMRLSDLGRGPRR
jgi:hypothetical protein